jgi:hypothetical protein
VLHAYREPNGEGIPTAPIFQLEDRVEIAPILCFFLAISVMVPIAPDARLTAFDAISGFLIIHYWRLVRQVFRLAIALLLISLAAMVASAYFNGSDSYALAGRAYQPVALLTEVMGYFILITATSWQGRAAAVLGAMAGICSHYFYPSDLRIIDEPIKFLIGVPLGAGLLALYALVIRRVSASVLLIAGLMAAYALFCFLAGSRSIGGVYFASALLVGVVGFIRIPLNYSKLAPFVIIVIALTGYGFTEIYTFLAVKGFFGERAAGIAAFQSSFGSIILGGRPEIIVNISGIRDAPIVGVGILNYPSLYVYEMIRLSVYSENSVLDLSNILYHSALFATAFESGLIAASFWAYMLYRTLFALPLLANMKAHYSAFVAPLLLITAWHILYSPPIPYNRFVMATGLAFSFFILQEWKMTRAARLSELPPTTAY